MLRKGGFGYLPQDPKIEGDLDGRTCVTHVLSGKGIDEEIVRIEKLRIAMEENPDERNVGRYLKAEESSAPPVATPPRARRGRWRRVSDCPTTGSTCRSSVLSGGERRRVELARILFAGTDVLCLDEPTNHLDIDAKTWLLAFMRQYKGALLVISHDLDLLDEAITRVLHLDRTAEDDVGEIIEYRGTYSQYQRSRAEDESARQARQRCRRRRSPACRRRRPIRGQGHEGGDGAHMEKRIARLETTRVHAPQSPRRSTCGFPTRRPAARP